MFVKVEFLLKHNVFTMIAHEKKEGSKNTFDLKEKEKKDIKGERKEKRKNL